MPDSPAPSSRRLSSREQVSRIDRGYFLRPSRFQSLRRRLILAALACGVAWCAWGAFDGPRHLAPGPVAAAHAKWEHDCSACHAPFTPIKDDTWLASGQSRRTMDGKCEACHRGPAHHPLQVAAEAGSCASCHADHRGRGADLSRVADRTCTTCHADIAAHRIAGGPVPPSDVAAPITRFDDEHHPPFAALAADPGRLKFSHGRHMRAGLAFGQVEGGPAGAAHAGGASPWTYRMLPAQDRPRYQPGGAHEEDLVQLSCASCHEFATTLPAGDQRTVDARVANAPPGAYALPVSFERHCAACHTLPFEGVAGSRDGKDGADHLTMLRPDAVVPHGLDVAGMERFLETTYLREVLSAEVRLLDDTRPRRPLPTPQQDGGDEPRVREILRRRVDAALSFTRGTCEKCHEVRSASAPARAPLLAPTAADAALPWFEVAPTRVPAVWLTKARFNHRPHQSYDCRECHAAAYPEEAAPQVGSPLDNALVMISGRETCTACHAPAGHDPVTGRAVGGARFDCVECHGYHGLGPHQDGRPPVASTSLR